MAILGFDVGGSSIKHGIIERDGSILSQGGFLAPKTLDDFLYQLKRYKEECERTNHLEGVGFSLPGAVDDEKGVIGGSSALPYIHEIPLKKMIEDELKLPVSFENDANCAALGEIWTGAAKDYKDMLYFVIGTGVGGAVVKDGKVHHGCHMHGGEFGYMVFDDSCTILSDLASTRTLIEDTARRKNVPKETLDGIKVFALAEKGDPDAKAAVQFFYRSLARAIYNLQYAFDPEIIVLGGAVSARKDLAQKVSEEIDIILKKVKVAHVIPEVVCCKNGNSANLLGAVYNFIQNHPKA